MVRELLITLPDRLKLAWRALLARLEATELRLIDKHPAQRGEERTPKLLEFEDIPTLYNEGDFPVVTDEVPGWSGNSTSEGVTITNSAWIDYA